MWVQPNFTGDIQEETPMHDCLQGTAENETQKKFQGSLYFFSTTKISKTLMSN